MAFKRRFRKRRRFGRRRRRFRPFSRSIKRVARRVKRLENSIETKQNYSILSNPIPISSTGTVYYLSTIAQGIDDHERIGSDVIWTSVTIDWYFVNPSTAASDSHNTCRFMVVLDKMPRGTLPAIGDILQLSDSTGTNNVIPVYALPNWDNRRRFRILYDKRVVVYQMTTVVTPVTASGNGPGITPRRFTLKFHYKNTYSGTTGVISQSVLKNLYLCYASDSSIVDHPELHFSHRLKYRDA